MDAALTHCPPADLAAMTRRAWARLARAVMRGASVEAGQWLRVHARMLALAPPPPPPPPPPPDPTRELTACVREIEAIARAVVRVRDDDRPTQLALEARTDAVRAHLAALNVHDVHSKKSAGPDAARPP